MALGVGWLHGFILILSSTLSCFCKEMWTFGVGWLREFIWILSSTLSCFCQEMWTSGKKCLHNFYTCAQLLYHRQEVILKTFNTSFEQLFEVQGFSSNFQGNIYLLYLYVTCGNDEKVQKKCRMYWK